MDPVKNQPRYLTLDALRGFAVMGILLMNIVGFAMPEMAYMSPAVYGGTDTPDIIAWTVSFIFVDGKMRGLFTLLFGASLMLIIDRAEANGENSAKVHYSRMAWLAVFGLAHYFLFWFGDILFLYAVIGCIAWFIADMKPEDLIRRGLLLYVIGFVAYLALMGGLLYLQHQASLPDASAMIVAQYKEAMVDMGTDPASVAKELAIHQSGFWAIVSDKISNHLFDPAALILYNIFETLPLMMIGMALYKQGFFIGQWSDQQYWQWGWRLTLLGGLLLVPLAVILISHKFDILLSLNASFAWTMPSRLLMTIGYASLLIILIRKFATSAWMHRVAAVGRAAFTNYLGTSIAMTFVFYGWGLGLFGQIGRAELYLFVVSAWISMLIWSKPWLMRFRYGPLEWLWRTLARRELQAMRIGN